MKIGHSGKYFEAQFVNSFHKIFMADSKFYIIRLKDNGSKKKQGHDVGDYLVFYKDVVFNAELKARKKGYLYSSNLDDGQIKKWASFDYNNIRVPIIVLKDTGTKQIGIFFKEEFIPLYKKGRATIKDSKYIESYNNSDIPYKLDNLFENLYNAVIEKRKSVVQIN